MKVHVAVGLAVIASLGLTACDKLGGGSRPTGQVVAKVGKEEVTALDLQSELSGYKAPNAAAQKAAEQAALNAIIQRKIIAAQARKEKLDKTPDFARQEKRATELLLARQWQDRLVHAVPPPSLEEAQNFVAQHPDLYSARKRISIEGVRFAPTDPTLAAALRPLNSIDQVQSLLVARKVPFQPVSSEIDALSTDPRFTAQLLKLPPGEVFIAPQGNIVVAARVREVKVDPVSNDIAMRHATEFLRRERTREAVGRQAGAVLASAKATVKYNKLYEPPPPAAAKPAAPAAPAASAPK